MKVVINKCYGGFGLSDKAVEACIALGMTVGDEYSEGKDFTRLKESHFGKYCAERENRNEFRCDPRVVQVVEELGEEAYGDFANLEVVEIPFDGPEGWYIDNYDGLEHIVEQHNTWG